MDIHEGITYRVLRSSVGIRRRVFTGGWGECTFYLIDRQEKEVAKGAKTTLDEENSTLLVRRKDGTLYELAIADMPDRESPVFKLKCLKQSFETFYKMAEDGDVTTKEADELRQAINDIMGKYPS